MTIDRDDPRLTAYALGELSDEETRAFEEALEGDPASRAEIEAIRGLGQDLEAALEGAAVPRLGVDRRDDLAEAADGTRAPSPRRGAVLRFAAGLLVMIGAGAVLWHLTGRANRPGSLTARSVRTVAEERTGNDAIRGSDRGPADEEAKRQGPRPQLILRAGGSEKPKKDSETSVPGRFVGPWNGVPPGLREPTDFTPPPLPPSGGPATVDEPKPSSAPPIFRTEGYDAIPENPFYRVEDRDSSTFSIDVDTASYANVRRFLLRQNRLPPPGAVRIEELINYFPYDYAPPAPDAVHPFAWRAAVASCPWAPGHELVRVALQGKEMTEEDRPSANLVFLLDVSGSMRSDNKLPLVKRAMEMLVDRLDEGDRVSIVVYAGAAGQVLPATSGDRKATIKAALERLRAGGSTNGGQGIQLAYDIATRHFIQDGANRVILCTDGDFNVGISDRSSLARLIEQKAKSGVFLTVLGFGMGNLKDNRMEELSNKGNGNYAYVDTLAEARKVLVDEGLGTLHTIAKDVKIQVFFNPRTVAGWRLIGYENRVLEKEDFNDDEKDAGEIGAGHRVTALYEIIPVGGRVPAPPKVDPNPFLRKPASTAESTGDHESLLQLRLRYKLPDADTSTLLETTVPNAANDFERGDREFQWAAAVAAYGMLLRRSPHAGQATWALVEEIARGAKGEDAHGYRAQFLELVKRAAALSAR